MDLQTKTKLQDYLKLFYSKRWFILSFVILSVGGSLIFLKYERKEYISYSVILIDDESNNSQLDIFSTGTFSSQMNLQNHIEHLKSYSISESVYNYLDQNKNEYSIIFEIFNPIYVSEFVDKASKIKWLRKRINVELLNRKSDMIKISFRAHQPDEAKHIANAYVEIYQETNLRLNQRELIRLNNYIISEIEDKESKLSRAENNLNKYKQSVGIKSLNEQTNSDIQRYAEMKSRRESAQIELEAALESKKVIEAEMKKNRVNLSSKGIEFNSAYFTQLSEKIATKRAKKTELETKLKSNNISFETFKHILDQLENEIIELEKELNEKIKITSSEDAVVNDPFKLNEEMKRKYVDNNIKIKTFQKKVLLLDNYLSQNKIESSTLPSKQLRLVRLERDVKVFEKIYDYLVEKKNETEIKISSEKNDVKIIDKARSNIVSIYPKKMLVVAGAFFGSLGLSFLILFLVEYFDNTIKSEEEIKQYNIDKLGMVPTINLDEKRKGENLNIEPRLITHLDPKSIVSESYRSIRTNLVFRIKQYNIKSFLFTSCGPQEGKSTTISNIAISLAQQGKKIVVIDADLRRPVLHNVFSVRKDNGLSNYLLGESNINDIIQATKIDNVFIISSGLIPPNPSELLSLDAMDMLISELGKKFDLILFDTPPVVAVADAAILAERVDRTVLIFRANKTDRDMIHETKLKLVSSSDNLLGCIFNDFNFERHYGYKYKYYNYYDKT